MARTALSLITDAFYTSTIVSPEFQQMDPPQVQFGITLLNEIITDKTIEEDMIPTYTTQYDFDAVVGQEMYFIPGLTRADTLTFFINSVRYCMYENNRNFYFGSARANNIKSLPFNWNQERTLGGTNLFLYFFPDQNYPMQVNGMFSIPEITLFQDLSLVFDPFYLSYLKYRLAQKICIFYNLTLPPGAEEELLRYEQLISKRSAKLDMTVRITSTLSGPTSVNYGQANLGHGWTT